MVTKQYTFFSPLNISLLAIITNLFEEIIICKPMSSKPVNSEVYIISKGYLGPFKKGTTGYLLISKMEEKLKRFDMRPLIPESLLKSNFLQSIKDASVIFERQIIYIRKRLNWYDDVCQISKDQRYKQADKLLRTIRNTVVVRWYENNPV